MKIQDAYRHGARALACASVAALPACVVVPAPGAGGPSVAPPLAYTIGVAPDSSPIKWSSVLRTNVLNGNFACTRSKSWMLVDGGGHRVETVSDAAGNAIETLSRSDGGANTLFISGLTTPNPKVFIVNGAALVPYPVQLQQHVIQTYSRTARACDQAIAEAYRFGLGEGDSLRFNRDAGPENLVDVRVERGPAAPNRNLSDWLNWAKAQPVP